MSNGVSNELFRVRAHLQQMRLDPDECTMRIGKDMATNGFGCDRPGHPTPTSDCARPHEAKA